ncbi:MAG: copper chaperone PCu(A)C [Paracoccaceae bacterium]
MKLRNLLSAACVALFTSTPLFAGDVMVMDAYARVASKVAKSGAAFMMIHNHSDQDDRLIAAASDVAKRVELHTHIEEDGVMKMTKLEDGMIIPAGSMHALKRGADHVMFMGLTRSLEHGDMFELTLIFEHAGDVILTVPVDLERQDKMTAHTQSH